MTLLRVVVIDGHLAPDPTATRPGRGAWLHRDLECLELAVRRRAFSRALPALRALSRELDVESVRREIESAQGPETKVATKR